MPIFQQGAINTTALVVPDLYVQIVAPQNLTLNGVPTDILGVVGTATWGPVNQPIICSNMGDYAKQFGPLQNRKFDMGTAVAIAVQQGAQNFRCVRVSDGTDTAATNVGNLFGSTFTALYTGTLGNGITVTLQPGTKAGTYKYVITCPNLPTESFDNITGAGNAFYVAAAAAINSGQSPQRGASQIITMSAGSTVNKPIVTITGATQANPCVVTAANSFSIGQTVTITGVVGMTQLNGGPYTITAANSTTFTLGAVNSTAFTGYASGGTASLTSASVTLSGGTDGAASATAATLVGADLIPRTGMYALRGQKCSIGVLADADDTTQWTTQAAFGLSEGIYMMLVGPAGQAISNGSTGAVDLKASTGLDSYSAKLMMGDWVWWNDPVNGLLRLVSPQGFVAGRLANLSPEQSSLNKPLYSVVDTQKSGLNPAMVTAYSAAELSALFSAGIDVISNPQPGGNYWGVRLGHNSSSNAATNGDNYTRLTNYIAATLNAGMGVYVGRVINATLFRNIRATLLGFLQNMLQQNMLGSTDGSTPFSVICDNTNNPFTRTSLGYVQADVQVRYMAINEKFIVNIEGGQTVVILAQPAR